ncbi:MAG: NAD(P)H-binding protein [Pseudomonadota bacterium]
MRGDSKRVLVLGATGTIGRATLSALVEAGHEAVGFARPGAAARAIAARLPHGASLRFGNITDPASLRDDGLKGEPFDALISCLASRSGAPQDAWRIDHRATCDAIDTARGAGIRLVVLLSAICVQRPKLAFQQAKRAAETTLIGSGLDYVIVRPTVFFKSLAGQIERIRRKKPYLLFGDGRLTACKPISDRDLARFLCNCVTDRARWNRILPVGGPGPAVTPRELGDWLFRRLETPARFRSVPPRLLDGIIAGLSLAGTLSPSLAQKAELARIGRYYATESMLVLNPQTGCYDATATPSFGTERIFDFFETVIAEGHSVDLGEHAVFSPRDA